MIELFPSTTPFFNWMYYQPTDLTFGKKFKTYHATRVRSLEVHSDSSLHAFLLSTFPLNSREASSSSPLYLGPPNTTTTFYSILYPSITKVMLLLVISTDTTLFGQRTINISRPLGKLSSPRTEFLHSTHSGYNFTSKTTQIRPTL